MSIYLIDANTLIYLAKSGGIASGGQTVANPQLSIATLNALLNPKNVIVVTDGIVGEITRGNYPDGQVINQWLLQNASRVTQPITTTGQQIKDGAIIPNGGEQSMLQAAQSPQFAGQTTTFVTDDKEAITYFLSNGIAATDIRNLATILNKGDASHMIADETCIDAIDKSLPSEDLVATLINLLKANSLWEALKEREKDLSENYDPLIDRPYEHKIMEIRRLIHKSSLFDIDVIDSIFSKVRKIALLEAVMNFSLEFKL